MSQLGPKYEILVVDDSPVYRKLVEQILANQPFSLLFARNGKEALELYEQVHPTLVTMDLTMPEMDGADCVAHLVARDPDIRILVVSALSDKMTAIDAIDRGASGFLCKPFTDRQLNDALRKLIQT